MNTSLLLIYVGLGFLLSPPPFLLFTLVSSSMENIFLKEQKNKHERRAQSSRFIFLTGQNSFGLLACALQ